MTTRAKAMLDALEAHDGALIPLRDRKGTVVAHSLIDEDNVDDIACLRWHRTHWGYAASSFSVSGRKRGVFMHRAILDLEHGDPRQGDHINGNRLDNRRCNLRIVTREQNLQNRRSTGTTSIHRGVSWSTLHRCWIAQARSGCRYFNARFEDEAEAAKAVSAWRRENMPYANEERRS